MRTFELKDIQTGDVIRVLEWGTWAIHRFCQLMGNKQEDGTIKELTPIQYLNLYKTDENGNVDLPLSHVIRMVVAAAESMEEGLTVTEREASRWIDQAGGLQNSESNALKFIRFTFSETKVETSEPEEKKRDD